ncbi:MAG: PDZ domain-containing protein [Bradymonadaceae bacterium]|nr:PDZ domain-containing protein [Lujinxingiaceae bacterium]
MSNHTIFDSLGIEESDQGYYRHPTVFGDRVVFVSEDDLWEVALGGGYARRLTGSTGDALYPCFSPDGKRLAYTSNEEGAPEVFVMDSRGGAARKLTFNGAQSSVVGWSEDGQSVLFRSNFREPFSRTFVIYEVDANGGESARLPVGPAHALTYQPDGPGRVLARHTDDLARWKRYRGGTAGVLWIDVEGAGSWNRLLPEITAGLCRPMWIGQRIYFLSDFEGHGNLYSCTPQGQDLCRHTDHVGFYARFASTDGKTIVYTLGGELYRFDIASDAGEKIAVDYASPRTCLKRKFVDADTYLDEFALHPRGHSLAVNSRGKTFNFGNWEGAVRQSGKEQGVRYRLVRYLNDGERLVVVSDEGGEERFEIHRADGAKRPKAIDTQGFDIGRALELSVSPTSDQLVFTNHRQELVHLDLQSGITRVLDRSKFSRIEGLSISADGRWVAYGFASGPSTSTIKIANLESGQCEAVTTGEFQDLNPYFDPAGRYLYFLSYRHFDPVYDQMFFDLSFPRGMKPCVVTLRDDIESPFLEKPRPLDGDEDGDGDSDADDSSDSSDSSDGVEASAPTAGDSADSGDSADAGDGDTKATNATAKADEAAPAGGVEPIVIDFEGIKSRVEVFPVSDASYGDIGATEDRVFWTVFPISGSLEQGWDAEAPSGALKVFSLKSLKEKIFAREVSTFEIGPDRKTMALLAENGIQVVSAAGEGPALSEPDGDDSPSRQTGWIDLGRISLCVEPRAEWAQMLRESWRLMRDHFWSSDMGGVDWDEVWQRYKMLLGRVLTRSEFSDLVWVMQGELGTSHAYEIGGDYSVPPQYRPGFLGVEVAWNPDWSSSDGTSNSDVADEDEEHGAYTITRIVRGDSWNTQETSPLARAGVRVKEGDHIVSVNGQRVSEHVSIEQRLINQAGKEVELVFATVVEASDEAPEATTELRTYTIKTLRSETPARYREWVLKNRQRVHDASDGQLGYVHIPDMGPHGFAEFHRNYLSESGKRGMVVDVRYNGGGHVSQLILEKLARKNLGYDIQRWSPPVPYPQESVHGPLVCLTNENAGSDGDIFSHCFKLMGLGPLLGKRTWGGVVGIWPRHALVDGSITTQPEFSFWFKDVGFGVENWGTQPDIEVELPPQADNDPQLDAALALASKLLDEQRPALPDFAPYPSLRPSAALASARRIDLGTKK